MEQPTASSPSMTLSNPNIYSQRCKPGGLTPRQRPSTVDGKPARRHTIAGKDGSTMYHGDKGTADARAYMHRERLKQDSVKPTSNLNGKLKFSDRMGKKSMYVPQGGVRVTRSAPSATGRPPLAQVDSVTFEVKMVDFPELSVAAPGKPSAQPPECWGPTTQAPSPAVQKVVSTSKTLLARKASPVKSDGHHGASEPVPVPSSAPSGLLTQTNDCGSVVASWANIASQPPKKPVPQEKTAPAAQEETLGRQDEKKRSKRKKKAKGSDNVQAETEELTVHQEPPKFEDEEEFPDLALLLVGSARLPAGSNAAKLCTEDNPSEDTLQSWGPSKGKAPVAKPVPPETSKKGQKPEKVSGKKSKAPVTLDIGNMLCILEKKQQTQKFKQDAKPVILSVGSALPVGLKQPPAQKIPPWQQDKIAHNPLDSTSPLVKKGKQREVPKAKKPTPLKRVILREREERKQSRLLDEQGLSPETEAAPPPTQAEEPCDTNSAEEQCSPAEKPEEEPECGEATQTEREEEEEEEEEEQEEEEEEEGGQDRAEEEDAVEEPVPSPPVVPCRPKIHSRKFRDYCSQVLSKDVDECVTTLLKELVRFQDRLYHKDPMKARMKRRLVMGLREVLKHLKLRKVKCVIISPNCERIQSKGGLDEALHTIIDTCREQAVPFVFALNRKTLGRCVNKAVPVSLVGIFNYDGAQDYYHKMIELSSEARKAYEVMVESLEEPGPEDSVEEKPNTEQEPGQEPMQAEQPEYIKIWKKMLENECNYKFLNFEERLGSTHSGGCTEQAGEEEQS